MPKRIDSDAREVEVAEAAWRVLDAGGVRALSVRNVAAEAGLATGSLRRAFPTQQSLMEFCLDLVVERATRRIKGVSTGSPWEHALAVLRETLPLDEQRRLEMEVWLSLVGEPTLRHVAEDSDARLRSMCQRLLMRLVEAEVLTPGLNIDVEAERLHALLDGLALHLVRSPALADPDRAARQLEHHLTTLRR